MPHGSFASGHKSTIQASHWPPVTHRRGTADIWEYTNLFHQVLCAVACRWAAINQRGNCEVVRN